MVSGPNTAIESMVKRYESDKQKKIPAAVPRSVETIEASVYRTGASILRTSLVEKKNESELFFLFLLLSSFKTYSLNLDMRSPVVEESKNSMGCNRNR